MDKENAACNFRDERLKKRFRLLLQRKRDIYRTGPYTF
jgi:hypothetical protein